MKFLYTECRVRQRPHTTRTLFLKKECSSGIPSTDDVRFRMNADSCSIMSQIQTQQPIVGRTPSVECDSSHCSRDTPCDTV